MFQFLTHVELSRSATTILEMPQYVVYQKNVAYALLTLSTKFHTFNKSRTIMPISCAILIIRLSYVSIVMKILVKQVPLFFLCRLKIYFQCQKLSLQQQ